MNKFFTCRKILLELAAFPQMQAPVALDYIKSVIAFFVVSIVGALIGLVYGLLTALVTRITTEVRGE